MQRTRIESIFIDVFVLVVIVMLRFVVGIILSSVLKRRERERIQSKKYQVGNDGEKKELARCRHTDIAHDKYNV